VSRIPPEFGGIRDNFCKNLDCENYGIPAAQITGRRSPRREHAGVMMSRGNLSPIE